MPANAPWDVRLAKQALKALDKIPRSMWPRVERAIDELADDPRRGDVLPLQGAEWQGCFRKRVGSFRVIFTLDHAARVLTVIDVLRRSEKTYR